MNAVQLAQYYNGDHEPATAAPSPKLSFVGTAFSDSLRLPIPTPRSWQPSPRLWRSLWRRWKPRLSRRKSTAKIAPRAVKDDPDEEPGIIEISAGLGSPNKADGDLEMLPTFPAGDEDSTRGQQWGAKLLMIYSDSLDKRPVFTKSFSSGLIGLFGDLLAQSVGWGLGSAHIPWSTRQALWRSCAVMLDGFFINGPLLHYAYEFLEYVMPAEDSILAAIMQVAVDVFVIDPLFAFVFVWSTGLIEGRSIQSEIFHTIRYDYGHMVLWLIIIGLAWAPVQTYLFNRYPVQFRVLMADMIDLVWTCVTSFFTHA